jgi:hypothetical protein
VYRGSPALHNAHASHRAHGKYTHHEVRFVERLHALDQDRDYPKVHDLLDGRIMVLREQLAHGGGRGQPHTWVGSVQKSRFDLREVLNLRIPGPPVRQLTVLSSTNALFSVRPTRGKESALSGLPLGDA